MGIARIAGTFGALALMISSGHAAVVTRTYDITASAFTPQNPSPTNLVPPYPAVEVNFTVTFDDSMSFGPTSNGLTVNSNTLPYTSKYEYDAINDILTIATEPVFNTDPAAFSSAEYYNDPNTYGSFIGAATGAVPFEFGLGYTISTGDLYQSGVSAVTASPLTPSMVPLPASAPMFGAGLIALGLGGYAAKRRKSALSA